VPGATAGGAAPDGWSGPPLAAPFLVAVPDYVQADWLLARPRPRPADGAGRPRKGRRRIGEGLHWAIHQAVLVQKRSQVILADVVLAQVLWGGDRSAWPRNWRRRLVQRLQRAAALATGLAQVVHRERELKERGCPEGCMLHGTGTRHQHLDITIATPAAEAPPAGGEGPRTPKDFETFLGALEVFGSDDYPDRAYDWAPRRRPHDPDEEEEAGGREAHQRLLAEVKSLKRAGRLAAVYFPLKLFGASPRLGLSWQERQLHQAVTRELTRGQGGTKAGRPDKAEVLIGGQAPDEGPPVGVAACPFLERGARYVGFNGNGQGGKRHLRGRGYRPLVWLGKAASEAPEDGQSLWRQVRSFLRDLGGLGELFGLVVAAWHPTEGAWRPLAELRPLTRTKAGRAWLKGCLLRVYTRDDFLARWRRWFAARMGFSVIPGIAQEQAAEPERPTSSREGFLAYLGREGVSPSELARQLGVSRTQVSYHLSGRRGWTASWRRRLESWVASEGGEGSGVLTHSL
jgi:hypothetical protein